MISGQDNFEAPCQLGFQRHRVKFTSTKSWLSSSRHYDIEETNRTRRRTYNTSDLFSEFNIVKMNVHLCLGLVSCDVLLPARRLITANDALSVSQILADNFENVMVTYASILTGPRPKSRRRHINKGWAWFEAMRSASLHPNRCFSI